MKRPSARGGEADIPRLRILVIDRDEQLCDFIANTLRGTYAVASAPHGAAALELVQIREPALILLDPRLPIMDGWSFVQQYRRLAAAPARIVAMRAAPDLPHVAKQRQAVGLLRKPFGISELQELLRHQLTAGAAGAIPSAGEAA